MIFFKIITKRCQMKAFYKFLRSLNFLFPTSDSRRSFRRKMDSLINGNTADLLQEKYAKVLERL